MIDIDYRIRIVIDYLVAIQEKGVLNQETLKYAMLDLDEIKTYAGELQRKLEDLQDDADNYSALEDERDEAQSRVDDLENENERLEEEIKELERKLEEKNV
jgi:peptidoglycan hydrolase CwlO-like protein